MTEPNKLATDLQIFYQNIHDEYLSKNTSKEKWTNIANKTDEHNKLLMNVFKYVKKEIKYSKINLEYDTSIEKLDKQIANETDILRKISFCISALHHIFYDLMTIENNYEFSLDGKKEMNVLQQDVVYYVNISVKPDLNVYFHAFILLFSIESLFTKHMYVGVDFEYTNKKIQLAQLNFEHAVSLKSMIQMVSPSELGPVITENFITGIMCNRSIKKILHGSDSLDIPYVYSGLLDGDTDKIIEFTQALIDTRFLCEYYKLNRGHASDNKCAIYDQESDRSAIHYFKVVSDEQQEKLAELLEAMPAPHDIAWNIRKMPRSQVMYALYDVIFLKYFYYRMINVATMDDSSDAEKKSTIKMYKHIIPELTEFVYLENRDITTLKAKCKEEVDPVNNFFVRKHGNILKLIDIYKKVSVDLVTNNPHVDITKVTNVSHFRTTVNILIKRLVYGHVSQLCQVFKDKSTVWTDRMSNNLIHEFFEALELFHIGMMFKELDKIIELRIKQICSR